MSEGRLIAFHGKQEVKDLYLSRVRAHRAADEIVQSFGYWAKDSKGEFKGCAVGCTLHSGEHDAYETELGIPVMFAYLEEGIFENMAPEDAKLWPEQFLNAIPAGADLTSVWPKFAEWLLVDKDNGVIRHAKTDRVKQAIQGVADLFKIVIAGGKVTIEEWRKARAYADADAAAAAAYADADAAAAAYAAAATAAAAAAAAAAAYADAAYADAAYAAARRNARKAQAEKLLELLASAPVAAEGVAA